MMKLWALIGRPARGRFVLAMLLSVIAAACGVGLLGLSGWFLTAAAGAGLAGAGAVFNHLIPSAGVRGLAISRVLSRYAEQLVGHDATFALSAHLRPILFARQARSRPGLSTLSGGELSALIDDVDAIEGGYLKVIAPSVGVASAAIVAVGLTALVDGSLALLAVLAFAFGGAVLPTMASRRAQARASDIAARRAALRSDVSNLIENAVELDVYGVLPGLSAQAFMDAADVEASAARLGNPFRLVGAFNMVAGGGLALGLLMRAGASQTDVAVTAGAALAILAAFEACGAMAKVMDAAPRAGASAERLRARLAAPDAIVEPPVNASTQLLSVLPTEARSLTVAAAPGAAMIGPISFSCQANSLAEIIGPSGSGKTTLLEAIARLRPISDGSLVYAGIPSDEVRSATVLAHIVMAPQFTGFIGGALRAELALGRPDASDDEIIAALRVACVDEVVLGRDGGLEQRTDGGGSGFSGGELRRIGLARA
ncbi:MAG: ATP-binding cassette domain-containing protein, partial [Alphaproteobacteria bacterium]